MRLCSTGNVGAAFFLNRGDFLEPAEEADVWFEPNIGSADGFTSHQTITVQVEPSYVTCGNVRAADRVER